MTNRQPHILWDLGTAYDLFASLHVLHHPEKFGLRGSWAAGVRSRLAVDQRNILETSQELFFSSPMVWASKLPQPKDAATVLQALAGIPSSERLPALAFHLNESSEIVESLNKVADKRSWDAHDLNLLQQQYQQKGRSVAHDRLVNVLDGWSHAEDFGERYLGSLQAYVTVFFAEEERRIKSYLEQALAQAQELAARLDFPGLMLELSQGVKITALEEADEVTFAPSYWSTPLVMYDCVVDKHWVVCFGARPADVALVPGEVVPDAMLRALKALSDPTRLQILRYLSDNSQTPSQLARRLRLRAPTVVHHLNALRLAGLVYISMDLKEEKRYTVRAAAVKETFGAVQKFLLAKSEG
jgi:DNA-binding transcriptional ArsR family regulator